MGKHSQVRQNRFNKTMAVAVASGMFATGGVIQAVAPAGSIFAAPAANAVDAPDSDFVTYFSEIDGQEWSKDNPRLYTLRQAEALARTTKNVHGYIYNGTSDAVYRGAMKIDTVNEYGTVVAGAPGASNDVYINGKLDPSAQVDVPSRGTGDVKTRLYAKPGTWGAKLTVTRYSKRKGVNQQDMSTTSWYRVVDVTPGYEGKTIPASGYPNVVPLSVGGTEALPYRTTFTLLNDYSKTEGWTVRLLSNGDLVVTLDENAKPGTTLVIPVQVNYPNGTPEVIYASVSSVAVDTNTIIKNVRDNGDGTYTLIRSDDTEVPGKIDVSGDVVGIETQPNGSVVLVYRNGTKSAPINLAQTTVKETGKGTPGHTITITSPNGDKVSFNAFDNYVTDVKKNDQGNYDIYRSDVGGGKTVWKTIDLADLRSKIAALEQKDSPSRDEFKKVQDDIVGIKTDVLQNAAIGSQNAKDLLDLRKDVDALETRMDKVEDRLTKVEKSSIKEVRDNKDGSYTIIRQDGTAVSGKIDGSGNVTGITPNKDGSVTLTYANGTKSEPVKLAQTTITETNKGKPDHKVTITSPNGQTVTFNAFDNYVTEVKKNAQGNYDIYRSDVNDGKTVWRTIDLSDLRSKIDELEQKDSPSRDEFKKILDDIAAHEQAIDDLNTEIDRVNGEIGKLKGDVNTLKNQMKKAQQDIADLQDQVKKHQGEIDALKKRADKIEKRLDGHDKDIADLKIVVTSLENRMDDAERRLDGIDKQIEQIMAELERLDGNEVVEGVRNPDNSITLVKKDGRTVEIAPATKYGLEKCTAQLGGGLMALVPTLIALSQAGNAVHLPGFEQQMISLQKQVGIYNPQIADFVAKNGPALAAGAVGLATIGTMFIPGTCGADSIANALGESLRGNPDAANPGVRETHDFKGPRFVPKPGTEGETATAGSSLANGKNPQPTTPADAPADAPATGEGTAPAPETAAGATVPAPVTDNGTADVLADLAALAELGNDTEDFDLAVADAFAAK